MPLTNSWGKGTYPTNNTSALTGIFPAALVVNGELTRNSSTIGARQHDSVPGTSAGSGIYIPFDNLTGLNVAGAIAEVGNAPAEKPGPHGNSAQIAAQWKSAGAARFMLGVLEAGYAAQKAHAVADRLGNCVMTRSSLSVVDEDTLQKTFTVKFKLNHTSQEVEDE
jgi:hypothetical protein